MKGFRKQIIPFLLAGGVNFAINAVTYATLILLGAHYLAASGAGWIMGVASSYIMNRIFTFGSSAPVFGEFVRHVSVYLVQLLVSWGGLVILIEIFGFGEFIAFAINVVFVTSISFVGLRYFVFEHKDT